MQIDEIDPSGSNLAVLLKSLTEYEKKSFSRWTKENFGFFVWVESVGLHYSIKIESETDNQEYNINDMGFGYSQVLPIIASLWLEIFKRNKKGKYIIFVIEQPELHLHPEYQAKLSILFSRIVTIAKDKGLGLRIIFETHSKTMVDTLGDCIEDKIIEKDDVNIVLFQKESNQGTVISFSDFDEQGYLNHWPVGFFSGRL
ncbi:AAA family ATPase [Thiothrix unzii]|uniref:AAA family ATPase n=1 Tax=Thiothrix unzii TaxID=111769 RepID=A0A975IID9_9GAMM|nr:AAA family ATPase [Thiothrix unzii]QTR54558.1 AAA family ATPase [Thiothrix unzii]